MSVKDRCLALIDEQEAAELLAISPRTLQRWRYTQQGPSFVHVGSAVRYRMEDLSSFIEKGRRDHFFKQASTH